MRVFAYPAFANRHTNPYNSLLYDGIRPLVDEVVEFRPRRFLRGPIDIVHVHWPDLVVRGGNSVVALARASAFLMRLIECKARGAKLVWTVHNTAPHDIHHAMLEAGFWSIFVRLLDGLIFLSAPSRGAALAAHPALTGVPYAVIPHGHYKPVINTVTDRAQARDRAGLPPDKFIFLYFGLVRDYKNVPLLMREFLTLERSEAYLVIAGGTAQRETLRGEIEKLGSGRSNIRLDLRFIPDETLHAYLAACDVVVLPYRQVLNSGSVLLALSAGRPVIAPATGSLVEIAKHVGSQWMRGYSGELEKSHLLQAMAHPLPTQSLPDLSFFDWDAIARQTVDFYHRIVAREGRWLPTFQ